MVSWENTDLFLKHDGLPRTNKLAFKTWLINKYIMILHLESAFCLMHQLFKEIFQFLGKQQEHKRSSAELGLFHKEIAQWNSKYWNVRQKTCKRMQWMRRARAAWGQHSAPTGLVRIAGAQRSFCRTFIDKDQTDSKRQNADAKVQSLLYTLELCSAFREHSPCRDLKNWQGNESALGRGCVSKRTFHPKINKAWAKLDKILVV